jgi:hypothetical protein
MSSTASSKGFWVRLGKFLRQRTLGSNLAWISLLVSAILPWSVAISVKVHLDSRGMTTWDGLYFLQPTILLYELWATLWFALPGIGVSFLSYLLFSDRIRLISRFSSAEKALIVLMSLVAGALGSIPVFIDIFWVFHPVVLMLPFFITALYVGYYLLGFGAGLALAMVSCFIRSLAFRQRTY